VTLEELLSHRSSFSGDHFWAAAETAREQRDLAVAWVVSQVGTPPLLSSRNPPRNLFPSFLLRCDFGRLFGPRLVTPQLRRNLCPSPCHALDLACSLTLEGRMVCFLFARRTRPVRAARTTIATWAT
jgi:hypothetical protein